MAVLHEIAAKLESMVVGTLGTDLFAGVMPNDPDACVVVYETPGPPSQFRFGAAGVDIEFPGIKVRCRGARPAAGVTTAVSGPRDKAEAVYRGLAAVEVATLAAGGGGSSALYYFIRPQRAPYYFATDEDKRVMFDVDFICEKQVSGGA